MIYDLFWKGETKPRRTFDSNLLHDVDVIGWVLKENEKEGKSLWKWGTRGGAMGSSKRKRTFRIQVQYESDDDSRIWFNIKSGYPEHESFDEAFDKATCYTEWAKDYFAVSGFRIIDNDNVVHGTCPGCGLCEKIKVKIKLPDGRVVKPGKWISMDVVLTPGIIFEEKKL